MHDERQRNAASAKKREANRRNAQLSTGPKTERGKAWSRRNAVKDGLLASTLLTSAEGCAEDAAEFRKLVTALRQSFAPQGALEELWVARIAIFWCRQNRELECEQNLVPGTFKDPSWWKLEEAELTERHDLLLLDKFDRILRYGNAIQRQLVYSINELERLQRARKQRHGQSAPNIQLPTTP